MRFLYFLIFAILSGCNTCPLHLHTEYIGIEQLASYYVRAPDPKLCCPDIGQRLVISWNLQEKIFCYPDLRLVVSIQFKNGEEKVITYPVNNSHQTILHYCVNEDFERTGGIITYKAELRSGVYCLEIWKHLLWNETIRLDIPENEGFEELEDLIDSEEV